MEGDGAVLTKRDIGAELRKKRRAARLSQQNVADLMFWTFTKVSKIESNAQPITAEEYFILIEVLDARKVASFVLNNDSHSLMVSN